MYTGLLLSGVSHSALMLTEVCWPCPPTVRHHTESCGLIVSPSLRATCPDKERERELRGTAQSGVRHRACDMVSRWTGWGSDGTGRQVVLMRPQCQAIHLKWKHRSEQEWQSPLQGCFQSVTPPAWQLLRNTTCTVQVSPETPRTPPDLPTMTPGLSLPLHLTLPLCLRPAVPNTPPPTCLQYKGRNAADSTVPE